MGDALGARATITSALRTRRPNARFLRVAGLIEKRLGDLDAAAALLKRSVAVDPRDWKSWLAVREGEIYVGWGGVYVKCMQKVFGSVVAAFPTT